MTRFLALLVLGMLLAASAQANPFQQLVPNTPPPLPAGCHAPPVITAKIDVKEVMLVEDKPEGHQHLQHGDKTLQGLAQMTYGFEMAFRFERIRSSEAECTRIAEIEVSAGWDAPAVWLRPELQPGSCAYRVALDHEMQHIQNYRDHLERFGRAAKSELPVLLRGETVARVEGDVVAEEAEMKAKAMQAAHRLHDQSFAIAEAADHAMDTPEEYRRVAALCR